MKIGIDLGTSYSLVACMGPTGQPMLLPDHSLQSVFHTPSVVCISEGAAYIGRAAEHLIDQRPELTTDAIRFFKRGLGRLAPLWIDSKNNEWYAESIAALILRKLVFDAQSSTGDTIEGAVITVPANFNDLQRQAVQHAASLAEVPLLKLLDEPIAAALHYGVTHKRDRRLILAYDFGGGTFDVTVMTFDAQSVQVLATRGIGELGGKEIDEKVMELIVAAFEGAVGRKLEFAGRIPFDLRRAAEEIKIALSVPGSRQIKRNILLGDEFIEFAMSREQLTALIAPLLDRTVDETRKCIRDAALDIHAIQTVLLVGGSSMLPQVGTLIRDIFGPQREILFHEPSKAVALGAAINAMQLVGKASVYDVPETIRGVSAYSIGVRTLDARTGAPSVHTVIKRNTPLPVSRRNRYYTMRPDQERIVFDVVQYRDGEDPTTLGELEVGPFRSPHLNYAVELAIDNREDGTVAIEAFDAATNIALKSEYSRHDTDVASRLIAQRDLIRSTTINPI